MFKCINNDPNDPTESMWLGEKEIKKITPVVDKNGKPMLMVDFYDIDYCMNSTDFFEKIETSLVEEDKKEDSYIGKYVHVGGELNGFNGYIVDVKDEDTYWGRETMYYVQNDDNSSIEKWVKDDLYEITFDLHYKGLE
jgi:hypothetical protein